MGVVAGSRGTPMGDRRCRREEGRAMIANAGINDELKRS